MVAICRTVNANCIWVCWGITARSRLLGHAERGQRCVTERDVAAGRSEVAGDEAQQRQLSGAVGAGESEQFARAQLEVNAVNDRSAACVPAERDCAERRHPQPPCARRVRQMSQRKNGPPSSEVTTPSGSSTGAVARRRRASCGGRHRARRHSPADDRRSNAARAPPTRDRRPQRPPPARSRTAARRQPPRPNALRSTSATMRETRRTPPGTGTHAHVHGAPARPPAPPLPPQPTSASPPK